MVELDRCRFVRLPLTGALPYHEVAFSVDERCGMVAGDRMMQAKTMQAKTMQADTMQGWRRGG